MKKYLGPITQSLEFGEFRCSLFDGKSMENLSLQLLLYGESHKEFEQDELISYGRRRTEHLKVVKKNFLIVSIQQAYPS